VHRNELPYVQQKMLEGAAATERLNRLARLLKDMERFLCEWAEDAGVDREEVAMRFRAAQTRLPPQQRFRVDGEKASRSEELACRFRDRCSHSHRDIVPTSKRMLASFLNHYDSLGTQFSFPQCEAERLGRGRGRGGGEEELGQWQRRRMI